MHNRPLFSSKLGTLITIQKLFFLASSGPCVIEGTGLSATFGKDEADKIHQENIHKLQSMSEAEIMEEQRKLFEVLGELI